MGALRRPRLRRLDAGKGRGGASLRSRRSPASPALLPKPVTGYPFPRARWQSGYAAACKAADLGSIPGLASITAFRDRPPPERCLMPCGSQRDSARDDRTVTACAVEDSWTGLFWDILLFNSQLTHTINVVSLNECSVRLKPAPTRCTAGVARRQRLAEGTRPQGSHPPGPNRGGATPCTAG